MIVQTLVTYTFLQNLALFNFCYDIYFKINRSNDLMLRSPSASNSSIVLDVSGKRLNEEVPSSPSDTTNKSQSIIDFDLRLFLSRY
mmetsp:Transcript_34851/g.84308  ORF Transcript_34851/g.84308 Transcript_34851/m.84308 type:complete len:86 (-) Transcript_34851:1817-2074(-)